MNNVSSMFSKDSRDGDIRVTAVYSTSVSSSLVCSSCNFRPISRLLHQTGRTQWSQKEREHMRRESGPSAFLRSSNSPGTRQKVRTVPQLSLPVSVTMSLFKNKTLQSEAAHSQRCDNRETSSSRLGLKFFWGIKVTGRKKKKVFFFPFSLSNSRSADGFSATTEDPQTGGRYKL